MSYPCQNLITLILILMISIVPNLAKTNYHKKMCDGLVKIKGGHVAKRRNFYSTYILDVLWGQPIKLAQVASTSELLQNALLFFEIVPCHFYRAAEVQT